MASSANQATADKLAAMTAEELFAHQATLQRRLAVVSVPPLPPTKRRRMQQQVSAAATTTSTDSIVFPQILSKTDTHYDFLLKEMQWLAADFHAERKRHTTHRRKLASNMQQHFHSRESRRIRTLAEAELKRRRLAAKLGRDVMKQWWTKIDRVIAYKQKLSWEQERERAMNKQLIQLVQLTEQYTLSLRSSSSKTTGTTSSSGSHTALALHNDDCIEQALAASHTRRSKQVVKDYARMQDVLKDEQDQLLYGESTADDDSEQNSNASYRPSSDEHMDISDDESTMLQAEREERLERKQQQGDAGDDDDSTSSSSSFRADPRELQQLQEEANLPLETVLERLKRDGAVDDTDEPAASSRRVTFANESIVGDSETIPDDDEVLSDEEYSDQDGDVVDDETTMAQEEALPREMSAQEEIELLQRESEMSVEDLRKKYVAMFEQQDSQANDDYDEEEDSMPESEDASTTNETLFKLLHPLSGDDNDADENADDEGFEPTGDEVDDETTMEMEEKLGRDMTYKEEIDMLEREANMSIDELRAMYASASNHDSSDVDEDEVDDEESSELDHEETSERTEPLVSQLLAHPGDDADTDEMDVDEYEPDGEEEVDDETTMEAEEKLGRDMSYDDELALLKKESEMSIDELRAHYSAAVGKEEEDVVDESNDENSSSYSVDTDAQGKDESQNDGNVFALKALEESSERARQTLATRPYLLSPWVKLREYQQVGLNWLVSLQSRRLNGILADEMGLGKTLQTISLFSYLASYKGIWGPHLVVVPTSVLLNWETELKRFCPALKVLCYYGSAKRRKELRQGWTKTNWYHVVLTSYQLAVQDAFAFKRKKWYFMVLDEAQNIKNFASQRWQTLIHFNTQRRLLLTGTPLQNSLMELWSLLHFLMPNVFRSRKEFSYWFANPMSGMVEGTKAHNDDVINRLHGIIRPFVLRRLKKDVESQMPGKFEHIIKCQLSRRQMFIYEEYMARSSTRQSLKKGGNIMDMMNVLMQLRKVCNHPDLFEPRPVITPFVMEDIGLSLPTAAFSIMDSSPLTEVSRRLIVPIWSGSSGLPGTDFALRHDKIEHNELMTLCEATLPAPMQVQTEMSDPKDDSVVSRNLAALWAEIESQQCEERAEQRKFLSKLNASRCHQAPFAYPLRLLDQMTLSTANSDNRFSECLSSPASLLKMKKTQQERAQDVDELVKKFVFCVPKAGSRGPSLECGASLQSVSKRKSIEDMLLEPLEETLRPFQAAEARLSSFFPDKKLVQFDAGKLQVLAELLRELKSGGHRVLIFTQMSKMLDILEAFLNIHGYTYMRLDGSTNVERRQRLMDRFNSDDKVFCFILSTRSGGLGINLTGADTVIFYDSDWNPAQDAQAQDRAHRIGQTREVHIYRLVTQHTIEENILLKAQQKRNLDILVMDKGHFDSSQLLGNGANARASLPPSDISNMYTSGGLRDILGADKDEDEAIAAESLQPVSENKEMSAAEMEKAMASLEDIDDVAALQGAQKEVAEDLREFDESVEIHKEADSDDEDISSKATGKSKAKTDEPDSSDGGDQKKSEEELEKEFEAWQDKVGLDTKAIEASLGPVERYGLRFREDVDPYYSMYAIMEYNRKIEAANESVEDIDIAAIEREKAAEEQQAMEDGDLLATFPDPDDLVRQRSLYLREKSRLRATRKKRKLTGKAWEQRVDGLTNHPFWYNIDTGEALWEKPKVLEELEEFDLATDKRFGAMPVQPLHLVMEYLCPYPDRMSCALVCERWRTAATCPTFVRHVYPVEQGAYTREDSKIERSHYRTISDALEHALPGDTIELGDGHYWLNEEHIHVHVPVRLIGDDHSPSNVVVELGGTIHWWAKRGYCEGVTFRRPQISTGEKAVTELFRLEPKAKLDVIRSVFDNEGNAGPTVVAAGRGMKGLWSDVVIRGGSDGLSLCDGAGFGLISSVIKNQTSNGIVCRNRSKIVVTSCRLQHIGSVAVKAQESSQAKLNSCTISDVGSEDMYLAEADCTVELHNCT